MLEIEAEPEPGWIGELREAIARCAARRLHATLCYSTPNLRADPDGSCGKTPKSSDKGLINSATASRQEPKAYNSREDEVPQLRRRQTKHANCMQDRII